MRDIIKISLPMTNSYLIKGIQGYILVDCGSLGDEEAFLKELRKTGLSPASIRWLFLTHHHSDHCGLLPFLLTQNPDIRILMSRKCSEYLETGRHYHSPSEIYASKALQYVFELYQRTSGKLSDTFSLFHCRERDIILTEEAQPMPDFVGVKSYILPTPGHTEDSLSLIVGEDAFVGDSARNLLNFLGAPYQPILLYDRAVCLESWEKLLSSGVKRIHPGHGNSFSIERLIKNSKKIDKYTKEPRY